MAELVQLDCAQCGEAAAFTRATFMDLLEQAENTRINAQDSGSLNLSLFLCDYCLADDEADDDLNAAFPEQAFRP